MNWWWRSAYHHILDNGAGLMYVDGRVLLGWPGREYWMSVADGIWYDVRGLI